MRRVIDCVLPSAAVNRNSVWCGLDQVSCVCTARWLEISSTQLPKGKSLVASAPLAAASPPSSATPGSCSEP